MNREHLMTPSERALVDHAWRQAPRFRTAEQYRSFIRGFSRFDDSPALRRELQELPLAYEALSA